MIKGFLLYIIILYFTNRDDPKQHMDAISTIERLLKKSKNLSIVPLLSFKLNDNEIIWDVGLGCENESLDQGRSDVDKNIDISNCFFSRSSSYSGSGGVIYVNGGSYSMNVNYSMFYNCVCSSHGGAIYFYSSNSCLRMICANSCSASERFFATLRALEGNHVDYLSVSNCSRNTSGGYPILFFAGNQGVDNTNSSMNNAYQNSGISINYPSSFNSSHCTFSNNMALNSMCISFESDSGTISMLFANIVHNNSPYLGVVFASGAGLRKMMYCILHNNHDYLFCVWGSVTFELSHSFISHSGLFSTYGAVSTTNSSFTNRITYQLQFFESYYCNAQLPVPVPSPIIMQTPIMTKEKSPMVSLQETIRKTNEETLRMTYERTIKETLINTPKQSLINTIDQTIRETPKETIHRSYAECIFTCEMANWGQISVIFAFINPMIILLIS